MRQNERVRFERRRRGLGMIEATMSIVVVGVMFVSVLNTVGATATGQYKLAEHDTALLLAQDLMSEILQQQYEDPNEAPGSFGRTAEEDATGDRSLFDDVDDYHGWSSTAEFADGTAIPKAESYTRVVSVSWVSPSNLSSTSLVDTGVKRIGVRVGRDNRVLVVLWAVRTETVREPIAEDAEVVPVK